MFVFRKIWRALFFRNTRFEIRPFDLLPYILKNQENLKKFSFLLRLKETQGEIFHMTITQVGYLL